MMKKEKHLKKKSKIHHPIFHFDAILISLPPGTVSNSVNSWKNVAKLGSCNMICSTRACSKVNFFSFPRSCVSYSMGGKEKAKSMSDEDYFDAPAPPPEKPQTTSTSMKQTHTRTQTKISSGTLIRTKRTGFKHTC